MVTLRDLQDRRDEILQLADRHGAEQVRVFGSVARGENSENSDIDVLVRMRRGASLLDRIGLMHDLEDLLGSKVDVVNEKALHPMVRDIILSEGVSL